METEKSKKETTRKKHLKERKCLNNWKANIKKKRRGKRKKWKRINGEENIQINVRKLNKIKVVGWKRDLYCAVWVGRLIKVANLVGRECCSFGGYLENS